LYCQKRGQEKKFDIEGTAVKEFFLFLNKPVSHRQADLLRIFCYLFIFVIFSGVSKANYAGLPGEFWSPPSTLNWLTTLRPPLEHFPIFELIWKISLLTSALGLFTPLSKWTAFIGFLFVGQYNVFVGHFLTAASSYPLIFLLFYLCFFKCHYQLSIDYFLFKKRNEPALPQAWPIWSFQIIFVSFYMLTVIQKLRYSGWNWLNGSYLHSLLEKAPGLSYQKYYSGFDWLKIDLYPPAAALLPLQNSFVLSILSIFILSLEFGAFLLFTRFRYPMLVLLTGFHFANFFILKVEFWPWMAGLMTFLIAPPSFSKSRNAK
jgi:hypothetical protein